MTWAFWIAAALFCALVGAVVLLELQQARKDVWIGQLIRSAFAPEQDYVIVHPAIYDWSARGDFDG